jgi:hypothetical protein
VVPTNFSFFVQVRVQNPNHKSFCPVIGFLDKASTCGAVGRVSRSLATSDVAATSKCRFLVVDVVGTFRRSSLSDSSPQPVPGHWLSLKSWEECLLEVR